MNKARILDLFCGAGGMSKGYVEAGFEVIGVDIERQPHYFDQSRLYYGDALEWLQKLSAGVEFAAGPFDAIHASPPCQAYSASTKARRNEGHAYPRLIEPVRALLKVTGLPYVIENVMGAPLDNPVMLCGTMFPELRVLRHRLFETNFYVQKLPHETPHPLVMTHDKRKAHYKKLDQWTDYVGVHGGGQGATIAASRQAMGIDWMTKAELNQAIPPAYARYIGAALIAHLKETT